MMMLQPVLYMMMLQPVLYMMMLQPVLYDDATTCAVHDDRYTNWNSNFAEFSIRPWVFAHDWLHGVESGGKPLINEYTSFVIARNAKTPLAPFHKYLLQPFTRNGITTFADFSSRQPLNTPCNHTNEGVRVRCFEQIVICRFIHYKMDTRKVSLSTMEYYQNISLIPAPAVNFGPGLTNTTLKVLFVARKLEANRRILNLDFLLQACEEGMLNLPGPPIVEVRCRKHVFGVDWFTDVATAREANVLVFVHGSEMSYAMFMHPGSAAIEVRPKGVGTQQGWVTDNWLPSFTGNSGWEVMFWAINMESTATYFKSDLEEEGVNLDGFARVIYRHTYLPQHVLRRALQNIAAVGGRREEYVKFFDKQKVWLNYADGKMVYGKPQWINDTAVFPNITEP